MLNHLVNNLRSRIVRHGEIDSEAVGQIEDRFAAKVQTLAIPPVRPVGAANFGHVEIRQFQDLSGLGEAVNSRWFDNYFDSLHLFFAQSRLTLFKDWIRWSIAHADERKLVPNGLSYS